MLRARALPLAIATLVGALLVLTGAAAARTPSKPGGNQFGAGCSSTSSAINQYCENIPSASGGGGRPPSAGGGPTAPGTLGSTLSSAAVHRVTHKHAAKLLSLPAPGAAVPVSTTSAHKSPWSLPTWLILSLIAIVAALGGVAALARRRHQAT